MNQQPTPYGQAVMQLAQARQQLGNLTVEHKQTVRQLEGSRQHVADLQDQVVKLATDIKALKSLLRDYHAALVDVREGRTLMSDCAFALEKRKKVLLNEEM